MNHQGPSIGTVLLNTTTGEILGVVVNKIPTTGTVILFRIDKQVHPTFSKVALNELAGANIINHGNITQPTFADLKLQLLKYYRTRSLSTLEKKILEPLMTYTFPNGIPLYESGVETAPETVRESGLRDKIRQGASFFLNTVPGSVFAHLDNRTVWITKVSPDGIWVSDDLKSVVNPMLSFIPYKDKDVPLFYGISKMLPGSKTAEIPEVFQPKEGGLSQIVYDGIKLKLDPSMNNTILIPNKYNGQVYDFKTGRICAKQEVRSDVRDGGIQEINELGSMPAPQEQRTEKPSSIEEPLDVDPGLMNWMDKLTLYTAEPTPEPPVAMERVPPSLKLSLPEGVYDNEPFGVVLGCKRILDPTVQAGGASKANEEEDARTDEQEFEATEFEELPEEDVQEVGTFQKVRVVEVPELMRTYKESLQRGQIQKHKLDKLPEALRDNEFYRKQIEREVNIISFIKSQVTLADKTVKLPAPDYKPLAELYMKRNFKHHHFLIPLVICKRKVFLKKKEALDVAKEDAVVVEDFYKHISELEKEKQAGGTKRVINLDEEMGKQTTEQAPIATTQTSVGMLIRLGSGIQPDDMEVKKLDFVRARERFDLDHQETLVVQYGQKAHEIAHFSLEKKTYDAFVALGPLSRALQNTPMDRALSVEDLDDVPVDNVYGPHQDYYFGDNLNLIGFVRPPVFEEHPRLSAMNDAKIIIRHFNKLGEEDMPLDDPNKYIVYLFPNGGLNEAKLQDYLNKAIPTVNEITELFTTTWKVDSMANMHRLIDLLSRFNYDAQTLDSAMASRGLEQNMQHSVKMTYEEYESSMAPIEKQLVEAMTDYSAKMDKLAKLRTYKAKKSAELTGLKKETQAAPAAGPARVITDDLIELADKVYSEDYGKLMAGVSMAKTDEYRLDYYAKKEPDNSRLMNLLIKQKALKIFEKENNREKLENTLFVLKSKYESMASVSGGSTEGGSGACQLKMDRKPKIIKYPSVERLKEDNGKVITNPRGEVILPGDYAIAEDATTGGKMVFKREQLTEGDYWIGQPISVLESLLLKKKREDCQGSPDYGGMKLPEEQLKDTASDPNKAAALEEPMCVFDPEKITCGQPMDPELKDLENRINDVKRTLDFVSQVPTYLSETNNQMAGLEGEIRSYLAGLTALNKYHEAHYLEEQRRLEGMIRRRKDCVHYGVLDYVHGLKNLTDMEMYGLWSEVLERFQNVDQLDQLKLGTVDPKGDNHVECYVCAQPLLCKHYAYAIKLMEASNDGVLDTTALIDAYGEEQGQSYYCRVCGAQIANTEVLDIEEFEKGEDGHHIKTREVLDDVNLLKKQQQAIDAIMEEALRGGDDREDLQMKLRIYKLLKGLCGLKQMALEDELEMVNYLKAYTTPLTRKLFVAKYYQALTQAGKATTPSILDKLADAEYWKYITADIMCRFLVVLQTSATIYNIYNKGLSNDYMGWPLIGHSRETELAGIELMAGCAFQMSLDTDFVFLSGSGMKTLLISRMDELIKGDELVRTRLDKALDAKYNMITHLEALEAHPTNYWRSYRPLMSIHTGVGWSPKQDVGPGILKEWTGRTWQTIWTVIQENMVYHAQMLRHNLTEEIKKQSPTTRFTLNTNLVNGAFPQEYAGQETAFNYYTKPIAHNSAIQTNLNTLREYMTLAKQFEAVVSHNRLSLRMPELYEPYQDQAFNIQLEPDQIKAFFLKYIDTGIHRGDEHLFNVFGRCLVSNQLKKDVMELSYSQTDFEKLLRDVYQRNLQRDIVADVNKTESLMNPAKYEASQLVLRLVNVLREVPELGRVIETAVAASLIDELHVNTELMTRMYGVVQDYEQVYAFLAEIDKHKEHIAIKMKIRHLRGYVTEMLELMHKNLHTLLLEEMNVAIMKKTPVLDTKKQYYGLHAKIDTELQALVAGVCDDLGLTKKEESGMESLLINLGSLQAVKQDVKAYLEHQEQIMPRVYYINKDLETDQRAQLTRISMLKKYMRDMRTLMTKLQNGLDCGTPFAKYKDNDKLFGRAVDVWDIYANLYNALRGFEPAMMALLHHYIYILALDNVLSMNGLQTHKETTMLEEPGYMDKMISQMSANEQEVNIDMDFEEDEEVQAPPSLKVKLVKAQRTQHEILVEFIKDSLNRVKELESVYNDMNSKRIEEEKARTNERQKRMNLDTFKFLRQDGMEDDYRTVINKMQVGLIKYSQLNEYVNDFFGEEYREWESQDEVPRKESETVEDDELQAKRNKFGLDDHEMDEMGIAGVAEEMENQDYGYLGVDEE